MEQNETIEQAISRELFEECGITKSNIQKSDFFMNKTDRIILAFVGTTDQTDLLSQQNGLEGVPLWVDKDQFTRLNINPKYKDFVLKNWS
jgi:NADH pyrophosphatase NudC (nudix superfamily)